MIGFADILLYIVSILLIFIIVIFAALFSWRLYKVNRYRKREQQKTKFKEILFTYLEGDASLKRVLSYLKKHRRQIPVFSSLCIQLLNNFKGRLEDKIHLIFDSDTVCYYFKQRLDTNNVEELANALMYFRHCRSLKKSTVERIKALLSHQNNDIFFAAVLTLVSSKRLETQFYGLKKACGHKEITKIALSELLITFSDPTMEDFNERGELLLKLVQSDDILSKFRPSIIKGLGEMNFYNLGPQLFDLLTAKMRDENYDEAMICELIETLGKLHYANAIIPIKYLLKNGTPDEKVSCVRALGAMQTDEATESLALLLDDGSDEKMQYEAMLQLINVGESALEPLGSLTPAEKGEEQNAMKKNIIQELKQIEHSRNG